MLISQEEKKSQAPLLVFIDLLFLLVAFFTLLLIFIQQKNNISDNVMEAVQDKLSRITGEEVDVPEALAMLENLADRYLTEQRREMERERQLAERQKRKAKRKTQRIDYTVMADGRVGYQGKVYQPDAFIRQVVAPLRGTHWVAFRAYSSPDVSFGKIVHLRNLLLHQSNEFDTYWDNLKPSPAK